MNEPAMRELTVVTPEQVSLRFRTAGLGSRAAAHIVDFAVLALANAILALAAVSVGNVLPDSLTSYAAAVLIIALFVLNMGYFAFAEYYMDGQTLGKRLNGLRVIQENGRPLTFLSAIIRNFFRLIDFLPLFYLVGSLISFFHPKDKRLGDWVAGTVVVRGEGADRVRKKRKLEKVLAKWNADALGLRLDDGQKRAVDADDWQLLSAFAERLPQLGNEQRERFAREIAAHCCRKLQLDEAHFRHADPTAFVLAVYKALRDDWEV